MINRIDVAGLMIDPLTNEQLFARLKERLNNEQKTFITTPYSEFLYNALRDREVMALYNSSDLAIADGIGVIWAQYFLSRPFRAKSFYGKVLESWWQIIYTGAQILLQPKKLYQVIPEKLVGANFFWDLAKWSAENNHSVYLLGWPEQQCELVKSILEKRYPAINIVGFANTTPNDQSVVYDIKQKKPDILMVAFGPYKQEKWISENLPNLPVKIAVGLGGSFDYAIGKKFQPPRWIRSAGLEWIYRLFTQPSRVKRIYQAFWGLIVSLDRYKVFMSMPLRKNAMAVAVNSENKILICKRAEQSNRATKNELLTNSYWQFPQGGVDENESLLEAAQRELFEETGIHSVNIIGQSSHTNLYYWHNAWRHLFGRTFKYPGQEQQTVFFRFTGNDTEINLDVHELVDYKWVSIEQGLEILAEERVPYAQLVLEDLKQILLEKAA